MALTTLDRFLAGPPDAPTPIARSIGDPRMTEVIVRLLSTSQSFTGLLNRDPELLGWLRSAPGQTGREGQVVGSRASTATST